MDNQLTFKRTISLNAFKEEQKCSVIQVVKSPKSQKLFFTTDLGITGAVSTKFDDIANDPKSMSLVETGDGEEYWMLHKQNQDSVVATF